MQSLGTRPTRKATAKLLSASLAVGVFCVVIIASRSTMRLSQTAAAGDDKITANAVAKANAFLESLDDKQREKVLLDYDSPKKPSWSNLPVTFVPRNGLPLGELTKPQRAAALEVVAAMRSKDG